MSGRCVAFRADRSVTQ